MTGEDINEPIVRPDFPAGTRLRANNGFSASVLIDADDPATPGHRCEIPADTILLTDLDTVPHATHFLCFPENYAEWESRIVRNADRFAAGYSGYRLLIPKALVGKVLELI